MSATVEASAGAPARRGALGEVVLDVRDLQTYFAHRGGLFSRGGPTVVKAVDGVSFDVRRGEIFGLVGESGSGKTTLGKTILGLVRATSGQILWKGRDLAPLGERAMRPLRRHLSMIFQDPNASLNPAMTVAQAVGHPLRIHGLTSNRRDTRARVAEMLERCGLVPAASFLDVYPEDLSGGQKQRIVIARALVTGPELVIADEPVAALDMSVRAKVLELMLDLQRDLNLTYLYITHDLASGKFLCDRIAIMYLGRMVEWGSAALTYADPTHPYTNALLDAVPLPDPSRRDREKRLPRGEIPDAIRPPSGCPFHPRCPEAFEACGWEGFDLIDAIEDRWTQVGIDVFERELGILGELTSAEVTREHVRFATSDTAWVRDWLQQVGPQLPTRVFSAVTAVEEEGGSVIVRFGYGPAPALQRVRERLVACHLHGITDRRDGTSVNPPEDGAAPSAGRGG